MPPLADAAGGEDDPARAVVDLAPRGGRADRLDARAVAHREDRLRVQHDPPAALAQARAQRLEDAHPGDGGRERRDLEHRPAELLLQGAPHAVGVLGAEAGGEADPRRAVEPALDLTRRSRRASRGSPSPARARGCWPPGGRRRAPRSPPTAPARRRGRRCRRGRRRGSRAARRSRRRASARRRAGRPRPSSRGRPRSASARRRSSAAGRSRRGRRGSRTRRAGRRRTGA